MQQEHLIKKYCIDEINKAKQQLNHKIHLRYRGRLEAFTEILEMITRQQGEVMND